MALLVDIFGYLTVVLHGLAIIGQSMAVGGVLFLAFLARPFTVELGLAGPSIAKTARVIAAWSAIGLFLVEFLEIALQGCVLISTVGLSIGEVLTADFAISGLIKMGASALLAILLFADRDDKIPAPLLLLIAAIEIAAATMTTHAAARLKDRGALIPVEALHQIGAAIWIGGIPCFVMALAKIHDGLGWRRVGKRFSQMSMIGVVCILISGLTMSWFYIGSFAGLYGTAFGVMVGAKIVIFLCLLGLGGMNYRLVERLRADPATPVTRLKRFAEVEIGVGFTLFFAAAALTSSPPAVDLTTDRVTWAEIVQRNIPEWPRLASPDHAVLALPALQAQLDKDAAERQAQAQSAFVPGSGDLPPRNAFDIAWSEYNHHWAGIFVVAIGLAALAQKAGFRPARHWPLLFFGLAIFLALRSDPEVWPLGEEGLLVSLRDPEVVQHRIFVVLVIFFALFEWRVQVGGLARTRAVYIFPLMVATGAALLLTHNHAISNIKDQLLIELTHTPLAIVGMITGWARWLELRLDPPGNRIAGWVWPVCLILVGFILLGYREA